MTKEEARRDLVRNANSILESYDIFDMIYEANKSLNAVVLVSDLPSREEQKLLFKAGDTLGFTMNIGEENEKYWVKFDWSTK